MTKTIEQITAEAIAQAAAEPARAVVGRYSDAFICPAMTPEDYVRDLAFNADSNKAFDAGYGDGEAYAEALKAFKAIGGEAETERLAEIEDAAKDEAVAALDARAFDGDHFSLHSTADASKLWVEGADIELVIEEALDPDNAYDSIEVEVYTTAHVNGGFKHLLVGKYVVSL